MNILLHIGQTKTGSSYIQSAVSLAMEGLRSLGIAYPISDDIVEQARSGQITSGNFWPRNGELEAVVEAGYAQGQPNLLISSEAIFSAIAARDSEFLDQLKALCPKARIRTLCYLRDPVDHAVSMYQQRVKRGGYTGDLAEVLQSYDLPQATVRALSRLRAAGSEVTLLNYSAHKSELLATFEDWLGVPMGTLPPPPVAHVNRSMTLAELELQKAFNRRLGRSAYRFVSDPLCNSLPEIRPETPALNTDALAAFLDRMRAEMSDPVYLDVVPESERPHVGELRDFTNRFAPVSGEPVYSFTPGQIEAFTDAISDELQKVERLKGELRKVRTALRTQAQKLKRLRAGEQQD